MNRYAQIVARLALGVVLLWAAGSKLAMAPAEEGAAATMYESFINVGSAGHYAFIGGETLLGAWLIAGLWTKGAAMVAILALSGFTGLIALEMRKDEPAPCGCLAAVAAHDHDAVRKDLKLGLGRNALLMSAAGWLFLAPVRSGRHPDAAPELAGAEEPLGEPS